MDKVKHIYGLRYAGTSSFFYVGETANMENRKRQHRSARASVKFEMELLETGGDESAWIQKMVKEGHPIQNKAKLEPVEATVNCMIPRRIHTMVKKESKRIGKSISYVVRRAIEQYVSECNPSPYDAGIGHADRQILPLTVPLPLDQKNNLAAISKSKQRSMSWVVNQALQQRYALGMQGEVFN